MSWSIGNHGFAMTLSPQTPGLIERELAPWMQGWLGKHGPASGRRAALAVHRAAEDSAGQSDDPGLPEDALHVSRQVLAECGNMSSPTVLFILERLAAEDAGALRGCWASDPAGRGSGLAGALIAGRVRKHSVPR